MSVTQVKAAPRWSVLAPVMPRSAIQRPDWRAINISESGMFVSGEPLLSPGSVVDVDIVLPGAYGPSLEITSRVEVVWTRAPDAASPNRPTGMGMRFLGIESRMEHELKAYLEELSAHQSTSKPRWSMVAVETPPSLPSAAHLANLAAPAQPAKATTLVVPVVARPAAAPPPSAPAARRTAVVPVSSAKPPPPPVEASRGVQKGDHLGRYTILDHIGTGGMGDVFLAEHTSLGRRVALKRLQEQHFHDRAALRRFYDEARVVNQISHDNIVQITDLVVGDDHTFIVMELLVGPTLSAEISRTAPMSLSRIANIGRQLCGALGAVHRAGIVHRDLKPQNIMLVNRHGNPDFVKLLDFGIAKLREESLEGPRTLVGQVVGTPGFMAPEQLLGEPVDARSDIYSLGVVMFAMLTGQMPFVAPNWTEMILRQIRDKPRAPSAVLGKAVPKLLEAMIMRCLDRDPKNRPANVAEVGAVLQRMV